MPTIAVLVKQVPDTWSTKTLTADNTLERNSVDNVVDEINEFAVEAALQLAESLGARVVAVSMGPAGSEEALRRAVAMGASDAVLLIDDNLAGSDAIATAWALNHALNTIEDLALIVAGNQSSDGETSLVPGLLAEYRQIPALTQVHNLAAAEGAVTATREDERGTWELSAALPAIVSVTEKSFSPRFPNFKGMRAAKSHPITQLTLAEIGVDPATVGLENSATRVTDAQQVPPRTPGDKIEGPAESVAAEIVAQLQARNLV